MVYQDYDEEDIDFDSEQGPVSVGDVHGDRKARTSSLFLHRKCFGVPVSLIIGVLLVASIVGISISALKSGDIVTLAEQMSNVLN